MYRVLKLNKIITNHHKKQLLVRIFECDVEVTHEEHKKNENCKKSF